MNWGVIGLGHMAKNFANSIKELEKSDLKGVSSRSFIKLIKFGYRFKIKPKFLYKNYEKLLLSNDVDNIYIGTLNHTHYELIQKSIDAGKNILCEKPFTIDLKQALDIQKKLHGTNVFFLEGIAYRSHPQTKDVLRLISDGHIGKVIKIKSTFGFDSGKPKKKSRLYNKEYGGGAILDLGCYAISFSLLIASLIDGLNLKNFKLRNIKKEIGSTGVDIEAEADLIFENGFKSKIKSSFQDDYKDTVIIGEKGSLLIKDAWHGASLIEKKIGKDRSKIFNEELSNLYSYQIENISKSLLNNKKKTYFPGFTINDTILNTKILESWINA